jgi:hypothetical protein
LTPGFKESRLDFSVTAQYLSSYGYKVILMEQPGEPNLVEFPDGEIVKSIFGGNTTDADDIGLFLSYQDLPPAIEYLSYPYRQSYLPIQLSQRSKYAASHAIFS